MNKQTGLADRIQQMLDVFGINAKALAIQAGIEPAVVSQWRHAKSKTLSLKHAIALAEAWNVRIRWLADGTGPMQDPVESRVLEGAPKELVELYEACDTRGKRSMLECARTLRKYFGRKREAEAA